MNIWNRFRAMTVSNWTRFRNVLLNIWKWLCNICYWIFYKKPLLLGRKKGLQYHHLTKFYWYTRIVATICWVIPWIFLLLWYIIIVQGCTSNTARGFLEDICIGPYLSPKNEVPWYLDLWNPQGLPFNHSKTQSPLYIESIMTGHMKIRDTSRALSHQVSKTEKMAPGFVTAEMLSNLSESNMVPYLLYVIN